MTVENGVRLCVRWPDGYVSAGTVTDTLIQIDLLDGASDVAVRVRTDNGAVIWAKLEQLLPVSAMEEASSGR